MDKDSLRDKLAEVGGLYVTNGTVNPSMFPRDLETGRKYLKYAKRLGWDS